MSVLFVVLFAGLDSSYEGFITETPHSENLVS